MHKKVILLIPLILIIIPLCQASNSSNCEENFTISELEELYHHEEKISYTFDGFREGDTITYWIEDLFGNIWKNNYTSNNNNKKSYTPKIEEQDRILLLKAQRERAGCNTTYTEEKIIVIREENITESESANEEAQEEEEDQLEEDIDITYYEDEIRSGEKTHIELSIQKNNNRNNAFYVYIEDEEGEKKTEAKINLHQKGSYEIELELPVYSKTCGNAFERTRIYFTGLGKEKKEKIYVLQEACQETEICAELTIQNDIVLEENNPIESLYVRAQKWQEEINLYSNINKETSAWIVGPLATYTELQEGTNSITINPKQGNNSYALITKDGQAEIVQFYLDYMTTEPEEKKENLSMQTTTVGMQVFSAPNTSEREEKENYITGEVIYTTKEKRSLPLLICIIALSSIGLVFSEIRSRKRKVLRSKNDSEKAL